MLNVTFSEAGSLVIGGLSGGVAHNIVESILDGYFATRYPADYLIRSTLISVILVTVVGLGIIFLSSRRTLPEYMMLPGIGLILAELPQVIDVAKVLIGKPRTAPLVPASGNQNTTVANMQASPPAVSTLVAV